MKAGRDTDKRAWLIAVAHPRVPGVLARPDRDEARAVFEESVRVALSYSDRNGVHPLEHVDRLNPRPGLKRWTAPPASTHKSSYWKEAWVSAHHDGSVTLAAAIGAHLSGPSSQFEGHEVEARAIESAIADFTGIVRAVAAHSGHDEYEVSVGIEWAGTRSLVILTVDGTGYTYDGVSTPLGKFTRVSSTINAAASDQEFHRRVYELAEDCINQGGITHLHVIAKPADRSRSPVVDLSHVLAQPAPRMIPLRRRTQFRGVGLHLCEDRRPLRVCPPAGVGPSTLESPTVLTPPCRRWRCRAPHGMRWGLFGPVRD